MANMANLIRTLQTQENSSQQNMQPQNVSPYSQGLLTGNWAQNPYLDAFREQELWENVKENRVAIGIINNLIEQNKIKDQKIEQLQQYKKKRKKTNAFLGLSKNKEIFMVQNYDTGEKEIFHFILGVFGEIAVYSLEFKDFNLSKSYFAIIFENAGGVPKWIVGEKEKLGKNYLYELFQKFDISFNDSLTENTKKNVLFRTFAPSIEQTESSIPVQALAGWNDDWKFMHSENTILKRFFKKNDLPILSRNFEMKTSDTTSWSRYFKKLKNIQCWKNRLFIMTFPVIGLLSSIFARNDIFCQFSINFVLLADFPLTCICDLLQVFNRKKLFPYDLKQNEKTLKAELLKVRDEVFLVNGLVLEEDSLYEKNKVAQNLTKIRNIFMGKSGLAEKDDGRVTACLASISNKIIFDRNVYNIIVSDDFLTSNDCYKNLLSV